MSTPKGIGKNKTIQVIVDGQDDSNIFSYKGYYFLYVIIVVLILLKAPSISDISPSTTETSGGKVTITGLNLVPSSVEAGRLLYHQKHKMKTYIYVTVYSNVTIDDSLCTNPTWEDSKVICDMRAGFPLFIFFVKVFNR